MTRRRPHLIALRSAAALGVAATLCAMTAPMSHALGLPEPVSTAVNGVTAPVKGATGGLGLPVPGATTAIPSGTGSSTSSARPSSTTSGPWWPRLCPRAAVPLTGIILTTTHRQSTQ